MPNTPAGNRFVIHHHTGHGAPHWDLMLEDGDALATWQLDAAPSVGRREAIRALRIEDHRKAYLTYEGSISRDRGQVMIHDTGTYATLRRDDAEWRFELRGTQVVGAFVIRRSEDDRGEGDRWSLRWFGRGTT
jgi:hypothetical protein